MPKRKKITDFTYIIYKVIKKIPKGRVSTYAEVASAIGNARAYRAVGNALNKNPHAFYKNENSLTPSIKGGKPAPCHRIIKSNGEIGGYAGGIEEKIKILESEGIKFKNGRIIDFEKRFFRLKDN
jgi:methylated-DNA-[protein]-cysteine S-methyltransferase